MFRTARQSKEHQITSYFLDTTLASRDRQKAEKLQATLAWADQAKIKTFYAESRRLTAKTGIQHHVDHIVPLINERVCGLHNEFNLRVITALANQRKYNLSWPCDPDDAEKIVPDHSTHQRASVA